ncbi:alpha/beta hydrolase [Paraburkholderia sp.]|uniref:alpha/beta hydrolase n=1 Tax=Paraburkholderia sp. TaxID=1926495 RepID=UPI00239CDDA2|nr:alpha/beta hydrolase [Paraburkholderia sp.]MDE1183444.1 alpha/beta hydrolase [Paraburkholderia sp.]
MMRTGLRLAVSLCLAVAAAVAHAQTAGTPEAPQVPDMQIGASEAAAPDAPTPAADAAPPPQAGPAPHVAPPLVAGPVRNVVLVHGAFVDGSSWNGVVALLQKKGFRVSAVQNPLTSLEDDVAATRRVLARQDGPTILVGHSWGGVVITELGDEPKVVGLVYVAAIAPNTGESTMALLKRGGPMPAGAGIKPDDSGFLWLDPSNYRTDFAGDIPERLARVLAAAQQPVSAHAFDETVTHVGWKSKPSWYIVTSKDRAVAPDLQRYMANRAGANIIEISSSHLAPVSHAAAVAAVIEQAAKMIEKH